MADSKFSSPRPSAINNNLNQNVITFFIGIVVLFLVRWFRTEFNKKRYNLPPRPKSFPIIGNLPQIIRAKEFFRLIMEYRNNYGEIFKISIGPYITVYVSDFDTVKEALVIKGEFLKGRPTWLFIIHIKEYTAPKFQEIIRIFEFFFKNFGLQPSRNFLPVLQCFRKNPPVNTMIKNDQILREYVQEKIQEHLETFDANNPKDFIDTFILMTKEEKSDSFSGVFVAPHVAEEDITLGNFDIPKGTTVVCVINTVHNDLRHWKNPEKFLPERWLTKDKKIIKLQAFLPFSWGPRSCLGEPLAKMQIFLFFTNLLQRFEFTDPHDEFVSFVAQVTGTTYQPIKTLICAKPL